MGKQEQEKGYKPAVGNLGKGVADPLSKPEVGGVVTGVIVNISAN